VTAKPSTSTPLDEVVTHMTLKLALGLETKDLGVIPIVAGAALVCWWARGRPTTVSRFAVYGMGGALLVLVAAVVAGSVEAGRCSPGEECDLTVVAALVWAFWSVVIVLVGVAASELLLHSTGRRGQTDIGGSGHGPR
jgi:hypothetical protein